MSVKRNVLRVAATTVASGILATGALALATAASASTGGPGYSFVTLDNANDPTFNQLLGINDEGVIAGYFGSGMAGHPNKGYVLLPRHGQHSYLNENFPGSVQTQVTGLNNRGVTVGFWSPTNLGTGDANFAWVNVDGQFRQADDPNADGAPTVDQLLGVNDEDVAVGFYTDANGINHGYEYSIATNTYRSVVDPRDPGLGLTAAAINDFGDVAGFYTTAAGNTDGFLLTHHGRHFTDLAFPGASSTMALGVNNRDEVVGTYTDGSGSTATMHGFTWTPWAGFTTVDDPHGVGTTTINGVNDFGQLVGFYVDANGNTDGLLATP